MQRETIHPINGIEICAESFGNPNDPAILLIMGAMCSMVYWDTEFCQRLADTGRFVIRYDNRDVGRSTTYDPGTSNYTVADMASDAVGVLDAYQIEKAHLVGMSLGGMIAQVIAVHYPQRVQSLTLVASGIFGSDQNDRNLPPMDESILAYHANAGSLDWTDEKAVASYLAEGSALLCGPAHTFNKERAFAQVTAEIKRARNLLSMFNHALLVGDDEFEGKHADIKVPTLVIHGTHDPVLPFEHARALVREIPEAALLTLDGSGHEVHEDDWDTIIRAVAAHTK
ncbi:alpha/beta fold hydrolase [Brevibacillus choshinensis]|uniref:Alpha/beta hydrolase n=1 Tax=Brevibacillus choshinensis TaxID=54911 RepID=A0ABX7FQR6_BRECH|nr:alpha/beta hydrolase [Brevibacillus choshinensis]QRG68507.1 alpha/beta hydrolase [Brevibacillus choshinensis]